MGHRHVWFYMLICALALALMPLPAYATEGQPSPSADATTSSEATKDEKKETPPPKKLTVYYVANDGAGHMDTSTFVEGQPAKLTPCNFTRLGYTFEDWTTEAGGGGVHFAEGEDISSLFTTFFPEGATECTLTLYAQWGSQIYVIRYVSGVSPEHSFPVTGTMQSQLAVHDAEVKLHACEFERTGYTAKGWMDAEGAFHEFEEKGVNFSDETKTTSWKLADVSIDQVRDNPSPDWTCQGTVVFRNKDGATCAAVAYVLFNAAYSRGSLDDYDSEIMVVNLDTGKLVNHASGLMLEHANDLTYCPDNGHFYVAMGGLFEGFPDGIVELDENLKEVRTVTPEGTHNIWNITYSDGTFYAIGNVSGDSFARGNPLGEKSDLIRLDKNLDIIDVRSIDYSPQGFTGQGMVCDGSYLYSIIYRPNENEAADKQRLVTFTLDGEARGNQYLDMPGEVESGSSLDDHLYFSINRRTGTTIYGTDLAGTTMTTVWKPNIYHVAFEQNGCEAFEMPQAIDVEYDMAFALPSEGPKSAGYEFEAWTTQADGGGDRYLPGDTLKNLAESGTVTLYAQWHRTTKIALVGDNGARVHGRRYRPAQHVNTSRHGAGTVTHTTALLVATLYAASRRDRRMALLCHA